VAAAAPPPAPAPVLPPPPAPVPAPPAAPVAAAAPSGILQPSDLHTSYLSLEQLIAERGLPMGTLDELVAGGAAAGPPRVSARLTPPRRVEMMAPEAPVVPIESLAPDEAVVPVETLLYDREAAWYRLQELKPMLAAAAVTAQAGDAKLAALISEVFDLVELSRR
jgi:hypothetical protein